MGNIQSSEIVLTLDAGGTNFVFSAIQGGEFIAEEFTLPSFGHDLDKSLAQLVKGFRHISNTIDQSPVAISFAFPGPADFDAGIIGDCKNLPGYRGGVALKPFLEHIFSIPVFIHNDGDLFAYGESHFGLLPEINKQLKEHSSSKQFKNLIGVTLGTGFGGGFVHDGILLKGDTFTASEIWALQHPERPDVFAEESLSIRGLKRLYKEFSQQSHSLEPKDIYKIAIGEVEGDKDAAMETFKTFGQLLGSALANLITIYDSCVVLGGGLSSAYNLFIPHTISVLNGKVKTLDGKSANRLESQIYDFESVEGRSQFLKDESVIIDVPESQKQVRYRPIKKLAIGKSRLDTSKAIALGAYNFAIRHL